MTHDPTPLALALSLGLAFLFGLAFEDFYASAPNRPGGVRTFPLLALLGLALYLLDPVGLIGFATGLAVLGGWMWTWYRARLAGELGADTRTHPREAPRPVDLAARPARSSGTTGDGGAVVDADGPRPRRHRHHLRRAEIMIPACSLVAYCLGPLPLVAPPWAVIGLTVAAVGLLSGQERLYAFVRRFPRGEIFTLARFLVLAGVILPLLPRSPVTSLTSLSPYEVWLAVVAISTLSYGSYLLQRYLSPGHGVIAGAALGGLYSSTAATAVVARRLGASSAPAADLNAAALIATAVMFVRVSVVTAIFNPALALTLVPWLAAPFVATLLTAWWFKMRGHDGADGTELVEHAGNPLEIWAALAFAGLFVVITIATEWARARYGRTGLYGLAAIVGVADLDPFVISLSRADGPALAERAAAIVIAISGNNIVKTGILMAFGRRRAAWAAGVMAGVSALGIVIALLVMGR